MSLIEKNDRILRDLESDWKDLGAMRQVNFSVRFTGSPEPQISRPVKEIVDEFVLAVQAEGCDCTLSTDQFRDWSICVSKTLAPSSESITELEEKLIELTRDHQAYVDGWHYPPKKSIVFWSDTLKSDKTQAAARAAVLFDGELVDDPLRTKIFRQELACGRVAADPRYRSNRTGGTSDSDNVFKLIPSQFLLHAQSNAPTQAEPTVSAFSQWVYSLYSHRYGDDEDRAEGKRAEQEIWERRGDAFNCINNKFLRDSRSPWALVHNGLHGDGKAGGRFFELPNLLVKGTPLRASPDLIYVNRHTSDAIILEIKFSHLAIPKNLWPNIWAQLWCYSQISIATQAKNLTVVGEVWGGTWSRGYGRGRTRVGGDKLVCLRASVRRNPRAIAYDKFFRNLFQIYAGHLPVTKDTADGQRVTNPTVLTSAPA